MGESILNSVKKMLGLEASYGAFDQDLIIHINTVFLILMQLGVGPKAGYAITGASETWCDFLSENNAKALLAVKSYMALKVRLLFDPPTSGTLIDAINKQAAELEWRLNVEVETPIAEGANNE